MRKRWTQIHDKRPFAVMAVAVVLMAVSMVLIARSSEPRKEHTPNQRVDDGAHLVVVP